MSILHAIVLGIVQGLTEFLPISSSGHLEIVPWLFGWSDFDSAATEKAFDTALHLGTLVAVLIYLRADLFLYIRQGSQIIFRPKQPLTAVGRRAWLLVLSAVPAGIVGAAFEDKITEKLGSPALISVSLIVFGLVRPKQPLTAVGRRAWLLVLSAVPAGIVGAAFEDKITEKLGSPALISVSLIVFGLVLIWADRRATFKNSSESAESLTMRDALVIGLAQVLALNPGTSRSGITITAARLSGYSREAAARLSFLMSVPIISGAVVFSVAKLMRDGVPDGLLVPMIVGIVTAAISGFLAMSSMIRFVQTKTFAPYVVYRCVIGAGVLIALATSWR